MRCIEAGVDSLQRAPEQYPAVHKDIRRAIVRRFPYCIFLLAGEEETIMVLAVFHAARNHCILEAAAMKNVGCLSLANFAIASTQAFARDKALDDKKGDASEKFAE